LELEPTRDAGGRIKVWIEVDVARSSSLTIVVLGQIEG
jgi:hypothetical protein